MKKKILMFIALFVFFSIPSAFAFTDTNGHDNEDAIDYLYEEGIVEGYSNATYLPDASINRAEFVKIVIEAKYPGEAQGSYCFSDVAGDWYAKYVCEAEDRGIVNGYNDNTFKPGNDINLAEALKIVLETYGIEVCESCYNIWYEPYFEKADELNLLEGIYQSVAHPITRGEMAQLIYNTALYLENKEDTDSGSDSNPRTYDEDDYTIYEVPEDELPYHTPGLREDYTVMAVERDNIKVYVPEGYEVLGMAHVEDLRTCEPLLSEFLGIPFPKDQIVLEIWVTANGTNQGYSSRGGLYYARSQENIDRDLEDVLEGSPDGFLYKSGPTYCSNTHELTHAFLYDPSYGYYLPSWGNEGIAEYTQSVNQGDVKSYISCESAGYYKNEEWFDYTDMEDGDFGGAEDYHTAMCFFKLLAEDYGNADFQAIIAAIVNEFNTEEATDSESANYHFVNHVLFPIFGTSFAETLEVFGIEDEDYAS